MVCSQKNGMRCRRQYYYIGQKNVSKNRFVFRLREL